jgi:hypothetical protein
MKGVYPAYLRGQAYLLAHNGAAAAPEFRKLLDHRGIVLNLVTGSLAHLQLGRAYALSGDTSQAKAAYQDFLTLWKDADPDIPILKEAKAEYAKLPWLASISRLECSTTRSERGDIGVVPRSGYHPLAMKSHLGPVMTGSGRA